MKITGERIYFSPNADEIEIELTFRSRRMYKLSLSDVKDYMLNGFLGLKEITITLNGDKEVTLEMTIEKNAKSFFERWQKKIDNFPAELRKAPQETYDANKEHFETEIINQGYIDILSLKEDIKQILKNNI